MVGGALGGAVGGVGGAVGGAVGTESYLQEMDFEMKYSRAGVYETVRLCSLCGAFGPARREIAIVNAVGDFPASGIASSAADVARSVIQKIEGSR